MSDQRDAADNIPVLADLPDIIAGIVAALDARAAAGEFDGATPQIKNVAVQLLAVGAAPSGSITGTIDNLTVTIKVPAAAKGDTGPPPAIAVRNVATGAVGSDVSFVFTANPAGGYFLDVSIPRGAPGAGSGDMLKAENLSGLANNDTALANLGAGTGAGGGRAIFKAANAQDARGAMGAQAYDDDLQAIANFASTNVLIGRTANGTKQFGLSGFTVGGSADAPTISPKISTVAQLLAGTAADAFITPLIWWGALAPVALADASTISLDLSLGVNFTVTIAGNRTLAAPVNAKPGQEGFIYVVQDGTGGRTLSFNAAYKFADLATAPSLNAAAGAGTMLRYHVSAAGVFYLTGGKPSAGGLRRQTLSSAYDPNTGSVSFDFLGPIVTASTWTYRVGPSNGSGALPTIERSTGANLGNFDNQIASAAPANSTGSFALDAGASVRIRVGNGNPGDTFVDFIQNS